MAENQSELERLRAENDALRSQLIPPEPAIPYEQDPKFANAARNFAQYTVDQAYLALDGLTEKRAKLEAQLSDVDKARKEQEKEVAASEKELAKWTKIADKLGPDNGPPGESVSAIAGVATGEGKALNT